MEKIQKLIKLMEFYIQDKAFTPPTAEHRVRLLEKIAQAIQAVNSFEDERIRELVQLLESVHKKFSIGEVSQVEQDNPRVETNDLEKKRKQGIFFIYRLRKNMIGGYLSKKRKRIYGKIHGEKSIDAGDGHYCA